ncbi:MAG: hypothetical protein U0973_07550 [Xanthomonadaceae bacterium]|nr:hypothetical protein [Xanthomonadaceae bacterium]
MASFDDIRTSFGQWIAIALFAAIWGWLVSSEGHGWLASIPAALIGTLIAMIPVTFAVAIVWRLVEGIIDASRAGKPPSPPSPTP